MAGLGYLWLKQIVRTKSNNSTLLWLKISFPLLIMSVIIGGRYEVGTDWENYVEYYSMFNNPDILKDIVMLFALRLEPMYVALMSICNMVGLSTSMFFTIIALGIFLFLIGGHKDKIFLFPLILFFFFGQMFNMSMNIIRQAIAISIFFFSLRFFGNNKIKMFICLTIAVLFHYSSIVLITALLLEKKIFSFLDKRNLILCIFIITYFVGPSLVGFIETILPLDYFSNKYAQNANNLSEKMELGSGLGIITKKMIDVLMILGSTKVITFYNDNKIKYIYRLYFVGIILANVVGISVYLSRLILGFELLRIFILSYYCHYAFNSKNQLAKLNTIFIIFWSVLSIYMGVMNNNSGCSPYKFLWQ